MQGDDRVAEALSGAGEVVGTKFPPSLRLYIAAMDALRAHHGDEAEALGQFVNAVLDDVALLRALARSYLEHRLQDHNQERRRTVSGDSRSRGQGLAEERPRSTAPAAHAAVTTAPTVLQTKVAASVKLHLSETILDTFRLRDGRPIGDLPLAELPALRAASRIEAFVLQELHLQLGDRLEPGRVVRELVDASTVEAIVARAKGLDDVG